MNAERLLTLFERVADAPDAVRRLRQFILDLAVRGKLVQQATSEEPAHKLLERIRIQRTRLHDDGAATRLGKVAGPLQLEVPFALPFGWTWAALGELCSKTGSGSTPRGGKEVYRDEGIPFLRSQNVYNDGLRLEEVAYIDDKTHLAMQGTRVLPGDLLLNITGGSIGRCCIVPRSLSDANVSQHVAIIRLIVEEMGAFLHAAILSSSFQSFVIGEQTGAGRGGLPKRRMDRIPVPLPPLAEQARILAALDELMALCDRLEAARVERDTTRSRLLDSLLAESLEPVRRELQVAR